MTPQRAVKRAERLMTQVVSVKGYSKEQFSRVYTGRYLAARRRGLRTGAFTARGKGPGWLKKLIRSLAEHENKSHD